MGSPGHTISQCCVQIKPIGLDLSHIGGFKGEISVSMGVEVVDNGTKCELGWIRFRNAAKLTRSAAQ